MLKTYSLCFYIQQLLKCQIFEVLILQAEISIFLNGHTAGVAVRSYLVCDKKRLSAPGTAEHSVQLCCSNVSWVRSNISIRERNLENLYFASIQDPDFQKKNNSKIVQYFHSDTASKNRAMQAAPMTVTSSTLISVCVSLEGTLMLIRAYRHCSLKPIHVVHVLCLSLPAHCFTRFHISKVTEADKQRKWARKMQGYFSM